MDTTLIDKYGWPSAILICVGWFLLRRVWPFVTSQIEASRKSLESQAKEMESALHEITEQLRHLSAEVNKVPERTVRLQEAKDAKKHKGHEVR